MTKEEIIEALQDDKMMPFIQPDHLAQIVDFVIKNYHPSLPPNLDGAADEWEIFRRDVARDLLRDFCDRRGIVGGNLSYEIGRIITYADELVRQLKLKEEEEK